MIAAVAYWYLLGGLGDAGADNAAEGGGEAAIGAGLRRDGIGQHSHRNARHNGGRHAVVERIGRHQARDHRPHRRHQLQGRRPRQKGRHGLITLDDSIYQAEVAQYEARLDLTRRNNSRAAELFDRKVATARTRDEASTAVRTAEAELALSRARLDKTRLNAPFEGVLGLRKVSLGDYVNPGQEIVNLEDLDPIKVDFRVPESALQLLKDGQAIEVQVDAFPGKTFRGEVYAINPLIDVQGRSVVVRARLPNTDGLLKPGLFARVGLIVDRRENAMLIPEQAVVPMEGRSTVFVVRNGKAKQVEVTDRPAAGR